MHIERARITYHISKRFESHDKRAPESHTPQNVPTISTRRCKTDLYLAWKEPQFHVSRARERNDRIKTYMLYSQQKSTVVVFATKVHDSHICRAREGCMSPNLVAPSTSVWLCVGGMVCGCCGGCGCSCSCTCVCGSNILFLVKYEWNQQFYERVNKKRIIGVTKNG